MWSPRRTTRRSASWSRIAPAAASAENSPSEWPASAIGVDVAAQARPARQRGAEDRGLREARRLVDAGEGVLADELDCRFEQIGTYCRHEGAHIRWSGCPVRGTGRRWGWNRTCPYRCGPSIHQNRRSPRCGGCIGYRSGGSCRRRRGRRAPRLPSRACRSDRVLHPAPGPTSTRRSAASRRSAGSSRASSRRSPRTRSCARCTPTRTSAPPRTACACFSCSTGAGRRRTPTRAATRACACATTRFGSACAERDAWLRAMRVAVDEAGLAEPHRERLWSYLESTANHMINAPG